MILNITIENNDQEISFSENSFSVREQQPTHLCKSIFDAKGLMKARSRIVKSKDLVFAQKPQKFSDSKFFKHYGKYKLSLV